ncbi:hypothetical protein H4219_001758 [Mycoemilia scoparia]|uniref:Uncharacterized protein n=1 Tax=Mycoemilia scoparia TaxID=417184 RepID=A0A9W8DV99_9FUNG|nr:hypothetical protein H4219_001758 [Mycoemilia scoparia]
MSESINSQGTFNIDGLDTDIDFNATHSQSEANNVTFDDVADNSKSDHTNTMNQTGTTHSLGLSTPGSNALRDAMTSSDDHKNMDPNTSLSDQFLKDGGQIVERWSWGLGTPTSKGATASNAKDEMPLSSDNFDSTDQPYYSYESPNMIRNPNASGNSTFKSASDTDNNFSLEGEYIQQRADHTTLLSSSNTNTPSQRSENTQSRRNSPGSASKPIYVRNSHIVVKTPKATAHVFEPNQTPDAREHQPQQQPLRSALRGDATATPARGWLAAGQNSNALPSVNRKVSFYGISPEASTESSHQAGHSNSSPYSSIDHLGSESRASLLENEAPPDMFNDLTSTEFSYKLRGYGQSTGKDGNIAKNDSALSSPHQKFTRLRAGSDPSIDQSYGFPSIHQALNEDLPGTFPRPHSSIGHNSSTEFNSHASLNMIMSQATSEYQAPSSGNDIAVTQNPYPLHSHVTSPMRIHSLTGGAGQLNTLHWQPTFMDGIRRFSGSHSSTTVNQNVGDIRSPDKPPRDHNNIDDVDDDLSAGSPSRSPNASPLNRKSPNKAVQPTRIRSPTQRSPNTMHPIGKGGHSRETSPKPVRGSPKSPPVRTTSPRSPTFASRSRASSNAASRRQSMSSTYTPSNSPSPRLRSQDSSGNKRPLSGRSNISPKMLPVTARTPSNKGQVTSPVVTPGAKVRRAQTTPRASVSSKSATADRKLDSMNVDSMTLPMGSRTDSSSSSRTSASVYHTPMNDNRNAPPVEQSSTSAPNSVNPLVRRLAIQNIMPQLPQTTPRQGSKLRAISGIGSKDSTPTKSPLNNIAGGDKSGQRDLTTNLVCMQQSRSNSMVQEPDSTTSSQALDFSVLLNQFDALNQLFTKDAASVAQEVLSTEQAWLEMHNALEQTQEQLVETNQKANEKQAKIDALESEKEQWVQERNDMQEQIKEYKDAVSSWRQRFDEAEQDREGLWTDGYKSRAELIATIRQLENDLAETRKELSDFKNLTDEYENDLGKMHEEHEAERKYLNQEIEGLRAEIEQGDADRDTEREEYLKEIENLKMANNLLVQRKNSGESNDDMSLLMELLGDLVEKNKQFRSQLNTNAESDHAINTPRASPTEDDGPSAPQDKASSDDNDVEQNVVQNYKDQIEQLKNDYSLLTETLRDMQEDHGECKEERDNALNQVSELRKELDSLSKHIEESNEKLAAQQKVIESSEERIESLVADNEGWELDYQALEEKLNNVTEKVNLNDSEAPKSANDEYLAQIDDLKAEIDELSKKYDELEKERDAISQELSDSKKSQKNLENQLNNLKTEMNNDENQLAIKHFNLTQEDATLSVEVRELERHIRDHKKRRHLLQTEQRYMSVQLREVLLNNAALRSELSEIILKRAGKLDQLESLKRGSDINYVPPNMVPSVSQIMDGSGPDMKDVDEHLADIQRLARQDGELPNTSIMMSPIRKGYPRDPSVHILDQQDILSEPNVNLSGMMLLSGQPEKARNPVTVKLQSALLEAQQQLESLQVECQDLRANIAEYEQERIQSHEDREEREDHINRLISQIEKFEESDERNKAKLESAGVVSRRVRRQADVLLRAMKRLNGSSMASSSAIITSPTLSSTQEFAKSSTVDIERHGSTDSVEQDELQALRDDNSMLNAFFDHPLPGSNEQSDNDASKLNENDKKSSAERSSPDHLMDSVSKNHYVELDLEEVGTLVSQVYEELKCIRSNVSKIRSERKLLLKRVGEQEHRKLPSWELNNKMDQRNRRRSSTFSSGIFSSPKNASMNSQIATPLSVNRHRTPLKTVVENLEDKVEYTEEFEPPMSLYLIDETQIMEHTGGASKDGTPRNKNQGAVERRNILGDDDDQQLEDTPSKAWSNAKEAEWRRKVVKAEFKLSNAQDQIASFESLVNEQRRSLEQARIELAKVQAENRALHKHRRSSISAIGPNHTSTMDLKWGDTEALKSELEVFKARNQAYFTRVDVLCDELNEISMKKAASKTMRRIQRRLSKTSKTPKKDELGPQDASDANKSQSDKDDQLYISLLAELSATLDVSATLKDGQSIKSKIVELAKEVRSRMREKEAVLNLLEDELDQARNNLEQAKTGKERGNQDSDLQDIIMQLEKQKKDAEAEFNEQKLITENLTAKVTQLQKDLQVKKDEANDLTFERDGWREQVKALEKSLEYEMEENDVLRQELDNMRADREKSVINMVLGNDGGNISSEQPSMQQSDWEQIKTQCTNIGRESEANVWRAALNRSRRVNGTDIAFIKWELNLWRNLMLDTFKDAMTRITQLPGNSFEWSLKYDKQVSLVQNGIDQFEASLDSVYQRISAINEVFIHQKRKLSSSEYSKQIDDQMRSLDPLRAMTWYKKLKSLISDATNTIISAEVAAKASVRGENGETFTFEALVSDKSGGRHPKLSPEQKAAIHEEMRRREDKIAFKYQSEVESLRSQRRQDRTSYKKALETTRRDFHRHLDRYTEKQRLMVYECRYLRGRIQLAMAKSEAHKFEKRFLSLLLGGPQGIIERMENTLEPSETPSRQNPRSEVIRRRWRRVLWIVRFKSRTASGISEIKSLKSIKAMAVKSSNAYMTKYSTISSNTSDDVELDTNKPQSQTKKQSPLSGQPSLTPSPSSSNENVLVSRNAAIRKNATPITPSKLRNIVSDLESSSPSSSLSMS